MMKQKVARIIAILLLVYMILNFCSILKNYDHDCTHHDDCQICVLLHQAKNSIESLGLGLGLLFVFYHSGYFLEKQLKLKNVIRKRTLSLFCLKVRLNN